jgi:hypothetical protein
MTLFVLKAIPVFVVGSKVDLLNSPKRRHCLFVEKPNFCISYWKKHKSTRVLPQQGLASGLHPYLGAAKKPDAASQVLVLLGPTVSNRRANARQVLWSLEGSCGEAPGTEP